MLKSPECVALLVSQRETCDLILLFFPKNLRTFSWLVPEARKSPEVPLERKPENMMDQVNFRARGDAWHPSLPEPLGLMS